MIGGLVDKKIMMESIHINLHCQSGREWRMAALSKCERLHEWAKVLTHPQRQIAPR